MKEETAKENSSQKYTLYTICQLLLYDLIIIIKKSDFFVHSSLDDIRI